MKITLKKLHIKNFKGFDDRTVNFKETTVIKGPNETGKSTINDAFTWLLFDKDSNFNSTFDIKPQDENGKQIHKLKTEVEGVLDVDGKELTLKKIFYEKWVKPRGQEEKVFKGNTTDYFINSVPKMKKEYDEKINSLIKEEIFKLLTDPFYFNTEYHWEDRRKILEEMAGEIKDDTIIEYNNLNELKEALEKFDTIEDMKKTVAYQKKRYKKELQDIPARIDELKKSMIDIPKPKKYYQEKIDDAKKGISVIDDKISNQINEGNDKINKEINDLKSKLSDIKHNQKEEYKTVKRGLESKKKELIDEIEDFKSSKTRAETHIKTKNETIEKQEEKLKQLRNEFSDIQQPLDLSSIKTECPTCGQELPEENIEEQKKEMKKNHIKKIQQKKEEITRNGKETNQYIETLKNSLIKFQDELSDLEKKIGKKEKELSDVKESLDSVGKFEFKPTDDYKAIKNQIETLEGKLEKTHPEIKKELKEEKQEYQEVINNNNEMLINFKTNKRTKKRISELSKKEKGLAEKISSLEKKEFMIEEFNRSKASQIEDIVNQKFDNQIVQFRLFEKQVNGNLKETCTALVRNKKDILVPYDSANNAGRINAGLAIIDRLTEFYEFRPPIFIDNAEGVNELYQTDSQQVKMYVTDRGTEFKIMEGAN